MMPYGDIKLRQNQAITWISVLISEVQWQSSGTSVISNYIWIENYYPKILFKSSRCQ